MIVSMWMTRDVLTIESCTPITEASALMAKRRIRRLPVVEHHTDGLRPVGIVTATDILHACPPEVNPFSISAADKRRIHTTAGEIMSRALQTAPPEMPIEDAARMMRNGKISTLLVVQKTKLVGLITESDIFRAFVGVLESARGDMRITFEITTGEDTFGLIAPLAIRLGVRVTSLMSMQREDRKLCVIRISGKAAEEMLDQLWNSGHTVINVLRLS